MIARSAFVRSLRLAVVMLSLALACSGIARAELPHNIILMIGDGMGPEEIKAASIFSQGAEGKLFMETLPHRGTIATCPAYTLPSATQPAKASAKVTDSTAAATALAAGRKVTNGVSSLALPGDGRPLQSILELAAAQGKMTGMVSTSFLTDATLAAFGAHVKSRDMLKEIASDFLLRSRPNLLLGGGCANYDLGPEAAFSAGYVIVPDRSGLLALAPRRGAHVIGMFGTGPMCYEYDFATKAKKDYNTLPHLSEMATAALPLLAVEPKGFFAMIEGGCIDKAGHAHALPQNVYETVEFDKAVQQVMTWASGREDTLVLVVADHETGGMKVTGNNGRGKMPTITWSTTGHTGIDVPVFAFGPGSEHVTGTLDNTDIFRLMCGTFTSPTVYTPPVASATDKTESAASDD